MERYGMYAIGKIWYLCHIALVKRIVRNATYLKAFGEHFRKTRKSKGMTMMELANEAEVAYTQVAKIEAGQINTTISTIQLLAETMNTHPSELFQFTYAKSGKKK
jgi:DNA-binding XRE family transcriptional regulator